VVEYVGYSSVLHLLGIKQSRRCCQIKKYRDKRILTAEWLSRVTRNHQQ